MIGLDQRFGALQIQDVFLHLLSLPRIEFEDRVALQFAATALKLGFDFSDAMHHSAYRACSAGAAFDDKGFAQPAKKAALKPAVALLE